MQESEILTCSTALESAIDWLYEEVDCVQSHPPLKHIYKALEQHPGRQIMGNGEAGHKSRVK